MTPVQTLIRSARLFHLYSGVFIAPALLFFAFTGGIQTFSLHETTRGSSYKPPAILVELGQLHKKQTIVVPVRKGPPDEAKPTAPKASDNHAPNQDHRPQAENTPDGAARKSEAADARTGTISPAPSPTPAAPLQPTKVHNQLPMKIFFLIVSIGLFFSTLTGLYMAYKFARRKLPISLTLLAGIAIPLLLLLV